MTNNDLFKLLQGLNSVGNCKGARFAYCVAKNVEKLTAECKLLEKQMEPSDKFKEYETKRIGLVSKYCDKNEDGSPKLTPESTFVFDGGNTAPKGLIDEIDVLRSSYDTEIIERNKQVEDFNILLSDESDFVPSKIKNEFLPDDITVAQVTSIMAIIED